MGHWSGAGWEAGGNTQVGYFEEHLVKRLLTRNIESSEHIGTSKRGGQGPVPTAEEEKGVAFPISLPNAKREGSVGMAALQKLRSSVKENT